MVLLIPDTCAATSVLFVFFICVIVEIIEFLSELGNADVLLHISSRGNDISFSLTLEYLGASCNLEF